MTGRIGFLATDHGFIKVEGLGWRFSVPQDTQGPVSLGDQVTFTLIDSPRKGLLQAVNVTRYRYGGIVPSPRIARDGRHDEWRETDLDRYAQRYVWRNAQERLVPRHAQI